MSDQTFQEAYSRVRARYNDDAWLSLHPRQITDAIYHEIKLLDAARLRATPPAQTPGAEPQRLQQGAAV